MKGNRILVADDNAEVRRYYVEELMDEGYDVNAASNGEEAVRIAREDPPDLIILDIAMPEKDGLETLSELVRVDGRIPVIVNTAYPMFRFDFRSHRAAAWLQKSSDLSELKSTIRRILDERGRAAHEAGEADDDE
ncbi:MAG: response regulator [bacterium]